MFLFSTIASGLTILEENVCMSCIYASPIRCSSETLWHVWGLRVGQLCSWGTSVIAVKGTYRFYITWVALWSFLCWSLPVRKQQTQRTTMFRFARHTEPKCFPGEAHNTSLVLPSACETLFTFAIYRNWVCAWGLVRAYMAILKTCKKSIIRSAAVHDLLESYSDGFALYGVLKTYSSRLLPAFPQAVSPRSSQGITRSLSNSYRSSRRRF